MRLKQWSWWKKWLNHIRQKLKWISTYPLIRELLLFISKAQSSPVTITLIEKSQIISVMVPKSMTQLLQPQNLTTNTSFKKIKKTSWTSKDTPKDSQNPSVTKIYSVGFNHDAELLFKKYVKISSHFKDILCKTIKQSDWQRKFLGAKLKN